MLIIPFSDAGSFKMQIQLSGETFFLSFSWNALNEFFALDISDVNDLPLILSIKIVPEYPLLYQFTKQGMPKGEIVCKNVVKTTDNVKRFDIGQKFALVYYEADEVVNV